MSGRAYAVSLAAGAAWVVAATTLVAGPAAASHDFRVRHSDSRAMQGEGGGRGPEERHQGERQQQQTLGAHR